MRGVFAKGEGGGEAGRIGRTWRGNFRWRWEEGTTLEKDGKNIRGGRAGEEEGWRVVKIYSRRLPKKTTA